MAVGVSPLRSVHDSPSGCGHVDGDASTGAPAHIGALAALAMALSTAPSAVAADMANSPYNLTDSVEYGVTARGTVRSCPGNINPNCLSTASLDENYGPAWRATETDVVAAAKTLRNAVLDAYDIDDAALVKSAAVPEGQYLMFTFRSPYGPKADIVEFLVKPEGVTNRNWEGDAPGALVTYRAIAGNVRYLYPFQQVISDFGAQKDRMARIRESLGWSIIGCELIECYQF